MGKLLTLQEGYPRLRATSPAVPLRKPVLNQRCRPPRYECAKELQHIHPEHLARTFRRPEVTARLVQSFGRARLFTPEVGGPCHHDSGMSKMNSLSS